jgi:chorismate mutase
LLASASERKKTQNFCSRARASGKKTKIFARERERAVKNRSRAVLSGPLTAREQLASGNRARASERFEKLDFSINLD